jgi:hypothetical protein
MVSPLLQQLAPPNLQHVVFNSTRCLHNNVSTLWYQGKPLDEALVPLHEVRNDPNAMDAATVTTIKESARAAAVTTEPATDWHFTFLVPGEGTSRPSRPRLDRILEEDRAYDIVMRGSAAYQAAEMQLNPQLAQYLNPHLDYSLSHGGSCRPSLLIALDEVSKISQSTFSFNLSAASNYEFKMSLKVELERDLKNRGSYPRAILP